MPLHLGSHTALMVISKCTRSLICFEISISFASGGKYSRSSQSIDASSSSSSWSTPSKDLNLSSPNFSPKLIMSSSSMGSSQSRSDKLEKTHSAAGSPHLQHKINKIKNPRVQTKKRQQNQKIHSFDAT